MGHYLTIQPWTLDFDSATDVIDKVPAWIRLLGMALHYYHKTVLRRLGQMIGRVIRIDYNTASATTGKFARIAIVINLNKSLVSQFY